MRTDPPVGSGDFVRALWAFARPHTVIGTTLRLLSLQLIACAWTGTSVSVRLWVVSWIACLGANVFIVGLNQLTDVEIDRINKPSLPLASGQFSQGYGRKIVLTALGIALALAWGGGGFLWAGVISSVTIGTLYSLPPVRLKRFPFWASASILAVRGLIVNTLLYLHFQTGLGGTATLPAHVLALTAFMFALSLVIAWFKDIPDMAGDERFEIATFSLRVGPERVLRWGQSILYAAYGSMAGLPLLGLPGVRAAPFVAVHVALLSLAVVRAQGVNARDPQEMMRYYLFIWSLFFTEYIVFPLLVRWG